MPTGTLYITGDAEADGLLNTDGTALLIGMLLDQQVPMEWAFAGPATLRARLGHLDARKIAALDTGGFVAISTTNRRSIGSPRRWGGGSTTSASCSPSTTPARPSGSGRTSRVAPSSTSGCTRCPATAWRSHRSSWRSSASGSASRPGWRVAAGKFGDDIPRSVADIDGVETLGKVPEWKRAQKAAKLDKQDRPVPT